MVDCIGNPLPFKVGDEVEVTNPACSQFGSVRKVITVERSGRLLHVGHVRLDGLPKWFCSCELKPISPNHVVKV